MRKMDSVIFELDALTKPVVDALHELKTVCVEAESIRVADCSVVFLTPGSIAQAVRIDQPSIIFHTSMSLDIHELIYSEIIEAGGREYLLNDRNAIAPTFQECLSVIPFHMKARNGEPYRVSYTYANLGLTRYWPVTIVWFDDLNNLLPHFIAEHKSRFEELAADEATNLDAFFKKLATEIANDERFVQAKGLRKKGLLVEAVWGEKIPRDVQSLVARLAQGEEAQDWSFTHLVRQANDIVDKRKLLDFGRFC